MNEDCFHLGIKALIRNSEGKILLLKVNLEELKGYSGEAYWDIPGGRIQKGGTIEETLKREVEEETGITSIKSFTPFTMVLSNIRIPVGEESVGLILASYLCEIEKGEEIKLSNEHTEFGWFTPSEVKELLLVKYPKEFIDKLSDIEQKEELLGDEHEKAFMDALYQKAEALVIREQKAAPFFLQRKLLIDYERAVKILEKLEANGIIGPATEGGHREVLGKKK